MTELRALKCGNAAICLPKTVMKALGLKDGSKVTLTVESGRAVIEPAGLRVPTLREIVAEMDRLGPQNAPEIIEWGPDVGTEFIDDNYSRGLIKEPDPENRA